MTRSFEATVLTLALTSAHGAAAAAEAGGAQVANMLGEVRRTHGLAKTADAIARGEQVATGAEGSVELRLDKGARLRLAPASILVLLGDKSGKPAAESTLLAGAVRVIGAGAPVTVVAGSARITVTQGEASVVVDKDKRARVAVHAGAAQVTGGRGQVMVKAGNATRIELHDPPLKPKAITGEARWADGPAGLVLTQGEPVAVEASAAIVGAPRAHLQLSRDPGFGDLIFDAYTPAAEAKLTQGGLAPGDYYARAAAVDAGGLDGAASPVAVTRVLRVPIDESRPGFGMVPTLPGLACGLDGAPPAARPVEVDRRKPHTLKCVTDGEPRAEATLALPEGSYRPAVRPRVEYADKAAGYARVAIMAYDVTGAPLQGKELVVSASGAAAVEAVRELAFPGLYVALVRWTGPASPLALSIGIKGGGEPRSFSLPLP